MSVHAMAWVWGNSRARHDALLVMLAIADYADDKGGNAWPSLATLADKARVSRRTVIRTLDALVDSGELERVRGGGVVANGGKTNGYRIVMAVPNPAEGGADMAPGVDLALVPSGPKVVTATTKGGDTPGTRTVKNRPNRQGRAASTAPPDLPVTDAMRTWCEDRAIRLNLERETERFLDWHRAKGSRFKDWPAAWRNWMGNTKRFGSPNALAVEADLGPSETYR